MRKKKENSEIMEVKEEIQNLKEKVETLCKWLSKKLDVNVMEIFSSSGDNVPFPEKPSFPERFDKRPFEHSYCVQIPSTSFTVPPPIQSLYDLADEENVSQLETPPMQDISVSRENSLNTPKKRSRSPNVTSSTSAEILEEFDKKPATGDKSSPIFGAENHSNSNCSQSDEENSVKRGKRVRKRSSPASSETPKRRSRKRKTEETVMCEVCGKLITGMQGMRRHTQTHTNARPHACDFPGCGKAFQRKFHLKTHKMIHTGEKKHQCRFCGKLFLLPKDITAHERVHTGEKPFSCDHCNRRFTLKSHLVMHLRTHTGEKPYKCDYPNCEKSFTQANSLRVHKKIHATPEIGIAKSEFQVQVTEREQESGSSFQDGPLITDTPDDRGSHSSPDIPEDLHDIGQLIPLSIYPSGSGGTLRIPLQIPYT